MLAHDDGDVGGNLFEHMPDEIGLVGERGMALIGIRVCQLQRDEDCGPRVCQQRLDDTAQGVCIALHLCPEILANGRHGGFFAYGGLEIPYLAFEPPQRTAAINAKRIEKTSFGERCSREQPVLEMKHPRTREQL